jgi:antirestriction protein ArdC
VTDTDQTVLGLAEQITKRNCSMRNITTEVATAIVYDAMVETGSPEKANAALVEAWPTITDEQAIHIFSIVADRMQAQVEYIDDEVNNVQTELRRRRRSQDTVNDNE